MSAVTTVQPVATLAQLHGVQLSFVGADGQRHRASQETLMAVLRSLGVPIESPSDAPELIAAERARSAALAVEPVLTIPATRHSASTVRLPASITTEDVWLELSQEDGEIVRRRLSDVSDGAALIGQQDGRQILCHSLRLAPLPLGYHQLRIEAPIRGNAPVLGDTALIISAPSRCPIPARAWGVFAPLHAIRGDADWGVGSYRDLQSLAGWATELGCGFLATLPIFATYLDGDSLEPSPYLPASRLAWNELYIDLADLPELSASREARKALEVSESQALPKLRGGKLSDPVAAMAAKREVLEPAAAACFSSQLSQRGQALRVWLESHPDITAYARFRALHAGDAALGDNPDDPLRRYHSYVQWIAEQQLKELGRRVPLYLDLPVGVHPEGFDPWWHPGAFLSGANGGAPPDAFFSEGQDWGIRPLHPRGIREQHYRYPIDAMRTAMRHAAIVRIDHVMSLHRLYVVPHGSDAKQGTYLRYRDDELRAIARLEAVRSEVTVVGEDLGTVPSAVRRSMRHDGMLRSFVWQFQAAPEDPLPAAPEDCLASLGTHDLPPFAAYIAGSDIAERQELGELDPAQSTRARHEREALHSALQTRPSAIGEALQRCLVHLASGAARLLLVDMADLLGEQEPQNRPGTTSAQGSFRLRFPLTLRQLEADGGIRQLLEAVDQARRVSSR